jgi:hypothetical protein
MALDFSPDEPLVSAIVLGILLFVALAYMGLRLAILFPAIAVDAPGATATNALADTKGHVLRIFLIFVLIYAPFVILSLVIDSLFADDAQASAAAATFLSSVILASALPLAAVVTARIFQAVAGHVAGRRPTDGPAPIS